MKANNLHGEYCQNCAATLDDVQRNHRRVIVLDSQCASVFSQSGDASRLDGALHNAPEIPAHKHKQETAQAQETVHTKAPVRAATKPAKASRR